MGLSTQVVDFVGLNFVDDPGEVGAVGQVAVVESELRVDLARWLVDMVDPFGIERGSTSLDPVDFIALLEKELGKVRSVLTCNAGDQGFFRHS